MKTSYKIIKRNPADFGGESSGRRWDVVKTTDGTDSVVEFFSKRDDARDYLKKLKAVQPAQVPQ
jgi:hypothetical protein